MTRMNGRTVALVGGLSLWLTGCPAFHSVDRDVERTPVVNTGAGASILYPGQTAPRHPAPAHPRQAPVPHGQGAQPAPAEGSHTRRANATPSGSGGGVSMLGGTAIEEERHQQIEEAPQYWKYLTLPFAIVAAPFVYAYDAALGEPEPGPPLPTSSPAGTPASNPPGPPPVDFETRQLEEMERELAQRQPTATPSPRSPLPATPSVAGTAPTIADELAALRGPRRPQQQPPSQEAPKPHVRHAPPTGGAPSLIAASGHVDRNGDGRTDHWIFRERGQIQRELFDEDFDGRPDRTLHYDLTSHRVSRIEEDSDRNGTPDTWTSLREGRVVGRRTDHDADGQVDTWTYYREGVVTRVERDASGNGFRDHVAHYVDGKLSREEQDDDGDGLPDLVTWYDEQERVSRVEEDANGDGQLDVVSHYEGGRLKSRELRDPTILQPGTLH